MVIVEGEGVVSGVNLGRPIVTNGDFVAYLCESDALFPNDFGEDLSISAVVRIFGSAGVSDSIRHMACTM